jgi:diadenosine tetraphosphate (Ap4A) HIT family hydrolase
MAEESTTPVANPAPADSGDTGSDSGAPGCPYCADAPTPPDQFYETKLFRVLVARNALVPGHVVIMPKKHDPHFYSFDLDELEEFGYLIKKVSFWAMRFTSAAGFTLAMSDGTIETESSPHLQIHVLPRAYSDNKFPDIFVTVAKHTMSLTEADVTKTVSDLKNLMNLPQNQAE